MGERTKSPLPTLTREEGGRREGRTGTGTGQPTGGASLPPSPAGRADRGPSQARSSAGCRGASPCPHGVASRASVPGPRGCERTAGERRGGKGWRSGATRAPCTPSWGREQLTNEPPKQTGCAAADAAMVQPVGQAVVQPHDATSAVDRA